MENMWLDMPLGLVLLTLFVLFLYTSPIFSDDTLQIGFSLLVAFQQNMCLRSRKEKTLLESHPVCKCRSCHHLDIRLLIF